MKASLLSNFSTFPNEEEENNNDEEAGKEKEKIDTSLFQKSTKRTRKEQGSRSAVRSSAYQRIFSTMSTVQQRDLARRSISNLSFSEQLTDAQRRKEEELLSISAGMIVLGIAWILLTVVLSWNDPQSKVSGWVAVVGASIIFGSSGVPMKAPSLQLLEQNAFLFSLFTCIGIFAISLPVLLCLLSFHSFVFQPLALLGSIDIICINYLAYQAVRLLGYSQAPAIWCSVGMMTAFLEGIFLFKEISNTIIYGIIAIPLLITGVLLVIFSQINRKREENSVREVFISESVKTEEKELFILSSPPVAAGFPASDQMDDSEVISVPSSLEAAPFQNNAERKSFRLEFSPSSKRCIAVLYCILNGLCDGSLMFPFKMLRIPSNNVEDIFSYIVSFSLGALFFIPFLLFIYYLHYQRKQSLQSKAARAEEKSITFVSTLRITLPPGVCCGMLWTIGNILSIYGTAHLGMKVGFPLTQTCVIFTALWGILYFREISLVEMRSIAILGGGIIFVMIGAYLLALSG